MRVDPRGRKVAQRLHHTCLELVSLDTAGTEFLDKAENRAGRRAVIGIDVRQRTAHTAIHHDRATGVIEDDRGLVGAHSDNSHPRASRSRNAARIMSVRSCPT